MKIYPELFYIKTKLGVELFWSAFNDQQALFSVVIFKICMMRKHAMHTLSLILGSLRAGI